MLQGIAVSQGIGLGRVMLLEEHSLAFDFSRSGGAQAERQRFHLAAESFRTHTAREVEQLRMCAGYEDSLILESHIDMACDPDLMDQVDRLIDEGACAEQAVQEACDGYIEIFSQSHDELTRLRAEDLRDVRSALLSILLGVEKPGLCQAPRGTVLVAKELSPSVMSDIDRENIVGIITETGGMVSHSSILARALGIPTVCGVAGAEAKLQKNSFVIVDGTRGEVICSPAANVIADYNQRREAFMAQRSRMKYFINRKTLSASGEEYSLACNITMPGGAARAAAVGADGVGLFRTEYLFMRAGTKTPPAWPCPRRRTPSWASGASAGAWPTPRSSPSSCGPCCGPGQRAACGSCCPWSPPWPSCAKPKSCWPKQRPSSPPRGSPTGRSSPWG